MQSLLYCFIFFYVHMHIKTIQQWESTFSGEGQVDVTLFSPFAPPPLPPQYLMLRLNSLL